MTIAPPEAISESSTVMLPTFAATVTMPSPVRIALLRLHAFLGFERGVFVQSSCHGTDHAVLVDLLQTTSGRYRGVGLLTPATPAAEVARLATAGVCGVRFHFMAHLGAHPSLDDLRKIMRLVAPHGWHIALHMTGADLVTYSDFITSITARVVISPAMNAMPVVTSVSQATRL